MTTAASARAADARHFRNVLGGYPTGVSVITSSDGASRYAMVVGTFTSISLDPPLIGFFPDKSSSSWPKIETIGRFCVNVLGADQLEHCGRFASKTADKFMGVEHDHSPSGLPILPGVVAWLDCSVISVQPIGDHLFVVGVVEALERTSHSSPLLFHGGAYHRLQELTV